jgi:LPS-assembly lipoprotein
MKAQGNELQAPGMCWSGLLLVACGVLLSSCGFHLRGQGSYMLPESLSTLRVQVQGSRAAHDPLLSEMQNVLRSQTRAAVVESDDVPVLLLSGEKIDSQVLSVGSTGKVAEYLLKYEVTFQVLNAKRQPLTDPQTVRLARDYRYDPLNVLSKEREEEELRGRLRRDAAQQVLRRLSKLQLTEAVPDATQR